MAIAEVSLPLVPFHYHPPSIATRALLQTFKPLKNPRKGAPQFTFSIQFPHYPHSDQESKTGPHLEYVMHIIASMHFINAISSS